MTAIGVSKMCVVFIKPANFSMPESDIRAMAKANPHGLGIAYVDTIHRGKYPPVPKIITKKFIGDTATKYLSLDLHEKQVLVHFRLATHGSVNTRNVHPFAIVKNHLVMAHNGVLDIRTRSDETDTAAYIRENLKPAIEKYGKAIVNQPFFKGLIERDIGSSKFVFMDSHDYVTIYNQHLGTVIKRNGTNVWVSNTHWEYRKPIEPTLWSELSNVYSEMGLDLSERLYPRELDAYVNDVGFAKVKTAIIDMLDTGDVDQFEQYVLSSSRGF